MSRRKNAYYPWAVFGYTIAYLAFSNRVQFFYIDALALGAGVISGIWLLFGFWNAINDPLMGELSDRTRSRWGRRVPYIRFGAIPFGIAFFLLWTPLQASRTVTIAYFLLAIFLFDTLASLIYVSLNSLFPEITSNIQERAGLAAARETLSGVALLLAFVLAPILSTRLGYPAMGAIIGGIAALALFMSMTGIRENPERQKEKTVSFLASIRTTLANKPFRWFLGAALMRELTFITFAATLPFWRKYVLQIQSPAVVFGVRLGPDLQEALLFGSLFLLAIPCLQIWRKITPRLGPRRAWIAACLTWIPGLITVYLAKGFYGGLLGMMLCAPALAGYQLLFVVTLSEISDYDARRTGEYREGSFFGIAGFVMRLAFSLQALLFALVLTPSGYIPSQAIQPAGAVNAIRLILAGAPLAACLICATCLYFMRIPRAATGQEGAVAGPAMPAA